jgi:uncharacterized delta-60 repeat protein
MEGYQNYQAIIDALKAEYVNARNLKKTATAKKRVATNAKSFKTRKENEKTSLETKLTSVENSLESNLETSFNNLEDARFDTLKSELSELKGKLAFIDADIIRLEDRNSEDPGNIGTYPSAEPTSIESQSLTVLRNMLSVTIADAELVITNLYDGQDYAAIKSATLPTQLTHTEQEVGNHYQNLLTTFDQLFDKTKDELDDFVISIFAAGDAVNNYKNQLIDHSGELVTLKSQLADLLNDEGTEVEINAKEQQIEDLKEQMLSKATDLKQIEVGIGSAMTTQKLVKLKRYATDLNSLTDELRGYRWDNHGFLKNQFPHPDFDIAYRSFVLYSGFFEFMDNNEFLNTSRRFNNGQWTEFKLLKQQITQAKEYYKTSSQFRDNAYDDTRVLYQTQQLFDCDQRNNGNGTEYYNITDFRPEVPQETKDFYVSYSRQLHNATSNYTTEMANYKFYKNAIQQHINDFEDIVYRQTINISALRSTKMQELWLQEDRAKKVYGHYEGTQEQHIVLDNTRGAWFEAEAEYLSQFYTNRSKVKTFELYNSIFPEFYSGLSTLESTIDNLNMSSLYTTYTDLQNSRDAAYAYLQTLTEVDEEYQAAFTVWNDATSALQSYSDAFGALSPQWSLLMSNIATLSIAYNNSLPGSINTTFAYGSGFNGIVYATAFQSDGKILVGGIFDEYNGTSVKRLVRLNSDGSIDTSFINVYTQDGEVLPIENFGETLSIAIQSDGKILLGGKYIFNGKYVIRLHDDGSLDSSFDTGSDFGISGIPSFLKQISSVAIQPNGKILAIGRFTSYNESSANGIIRLNSDGSIDTTFVSGSGFSSGYELYSLNIDSNGKILVGGYFSSYNGSAAYGIVRLNSDGSIDTSFSTPTSLHLVRSIGIQSDGKIVAAGGFSVHNQTTVHNILRLNSDGSLDTSFYPTIQTDFPAIKGFSGTVWSIAIQSDDKIVVGGQFNQYCAHWVEKIIRLNSDGSLDTSFVIGTGISGGHVTKISIKSDGAILVSGTFDAYKGTSANKIVLINPGGGAAEAELNVAIDALDEFQTNIRQPALNAMMDAEAAVTTSYNFLQTLTEVDEEYQAAFNDWNSKVDATNLFYSETLVPAENSFQSADGELNQYLSFNYGSDLNLSYTGTALKGFKDERDLSIENLQQAEETRATTEAAFIEVRNSMTFVQSTPLEKRQGMRMQIDVDKLHRQVERLESLASRYSEIFPQMVNQATSFASEVRYRDEAYFTGLLQSVKDFMDGVYSNNLGSNLYANKLNNIKWSELNAGKYQSRLNVIFKPLLKDWHMSFGSNSNQDEHINIADTQYNAIQLLSTDNGIDWFRQTISNINNELFRNVEGYGFGSRIIDEVNNGTPLV